MDIHLFWKSIKIIQHRFHRFTFSKGVHYYSIFSRCSLSIRDFRHEMSYRSIQSQKVRYPESIQSQKKGIKSIKPPDNVTVNSKRAYIFTQYVHVYTIISITLFYLLNQSFQHHIESMMKKKHFVSDKI